MFVCVISGNAFAYSDLFANNWYQSRGCLIMVLTNFIAKMIRFEVERFDRKINFGLWQVQVKDLLIRYGLHTVLKDKSTHANPDGSRDFDKETAGTSSRKPIMSNDDRKDLDELRVRYNCA